MAFDFMNINQINYKLPEVTERPFVASFPTGYSAMPSVFLPSPLPFPMPFFDFNALPMFTSVTNNPVMSFSSSKNTTQPFWFNNPVSNFKFSIPSFDLSFLDKVSANGNKKTTTESVSLAKNPFSSALKTVTSNPLSVLKNPSTTTSVAEVAKIYNPEKGQKLAEKTIESLGTVDKGYCARAVKTGIANAGLGAYESGDACDMPDILSRNNNFKEVAVAGIDLKKLPAGCVICYPPGDCGYNSVFGHTETSDGRGKGIHFGVTDDIRISDNARVFVPV